MKLFNLKSPICVNLEITSKCPYNCIFCEADIPHWKNRMRDLPKRKIFRIIDILASKDVFSIFLTGGEPLARHDFAEIYEYCLKHDIYPFTSTNGYLLNDNLINKLLRVGLREIQVSIHGLKTSHELVCGLKGSFERVIRNLKKLEKSGIEVEIACVGLKENYRDIPSLIRLLASFDNIKLFRVLRYVPSHYEEMLKHIPPRPLVAKYLPLIKEAANEAGLDIIIGVCPGVGNIMNKTFPFIHPVVHTCPAGKFEMTILPNGDVFPCISFKNRPEAKAGNILHDDFNTIWNHDFMVKLRKLTPDMYTGMCGKCNYKWMCYSCRGVAYNLGGDLYGEDISCYIVSEARRFKS